MAGKRDRVEGLPWYRAARAVGVGVDVDSMDQIDTSSLVDRARCIVTELPANAVYEYDQDSAAVADGFNVVAPASAVGRWILVSVAGGPAYVTQSTWFVDSATGDDANDGLTALTALQTLPELSNRLSNRRVAPTAVTVNLAGTFPTQDLILTGVDLPNLGTFNIDAEVTQQAAGSSTAFTQMNGATSTPASFTSNDIADFTPYLGMRLRWTSGAANGSTAWILKATAANVARVSMPLTIDGVRKAPGAGSTFVIEDLTCTVRTIILEIRGGGNKAAFIPASFVTNITAKNPSNQDHQFRGQGRNAYGLWVSWCRFDGSVTGQFISGEAGWQGNLGYQNDLFFQGEHVIYGHASLNGGTVFLNGEAFFGEDSFCQNGDHAFNNSYVYSSAHLGVADYSGTSAFQIGPGSTLNFVTATKVPWGTNNTGASNYGVKCSDNGTLLYSTKPTVTSGGGDAKLGALVKTWAQIPYRDGYDGITVGTGSGAMIGPRNS
jgi:hypothetical protein